MQRRLLAIVALCVLVHVATVLGQDKFPFSGEWSLNRQASMVSPAMAGVQSGVLQIDRHESMIRIHLTLVVDGKPFDTSYERPMDGREVTQTQQGRTTVSSIHWTEDLLVFSARTKSGDVEGSISVRYELQAGGRQLKAVEQIRGGGRDQDNVWIFDSK